MIKSFYIWGRQKWDQIFASDSLGGRFARGTFWSLVGTVIAQGLSMVASIVVARLLGKTGFGELGMINSTVGTFGVFAGVGLGLTATKYIAEYRTKDPDRAGRILGLSTRVAVISSGLVSLFLFIIAPWLSANTLNAPYLANELRLGCLLLFFNSLTGLQTGALSGFEAFKTITRVNFYRGLLNFPVMLVGVWLFGLTGAIAAMVIVGAIGWWFNHRALKRECAAVGIISTCRDVRTELPMLWNFAFPAFLSGIVVGPFLWISNTLLVNQPGGYGELGLLSAANQWRTVLMLLPGIFNSVSLPMLSSEQDNKSEFGKTLEISQSMSIIVIVPAATVFLLFSQWIMALYGSDFLAGGSIFVSLLSGVAISGIGSAAGPAIQAKGRMWLGAFMNLTWGLVYLVFSAVFVSYWKGLALGLGFALAYIFLTFWGYLYLFSRKLIGKTMVVRMFLAVGFVIVVTFCSQIIPEKLNFYLFVPIFLLSLWISLWVLPSPFIRQRLFSALVRGGKHAS